MKSYWRTIAKSGVMALSLTALVVATQSGTAQEVHQVASKSPKQETVSYESFAIEKQMDLFSYEQKKIAMQKKQEDKIVKRIVPETKISNVALKAQTVKAEVKKAPKPQPQLKPQPKPQQIQPKKVSSSTAKSTPVLKKSNTSFYIKSLPMSYELQKYLYGMTQKRGLDYKETLAFIGHESEFKADAKGANNYGYFQISSINHKRLTSILGTKNAPFDPYVNINWGTYMLSELYKKYGNKDAVLSAYNKGEGGYAKTGKATGYIQKHNQVLAKINKMS